MLPSRPNLPAVRGRKQGFRNAPKKISKTPSILFDPVEKLGYSIVDQVGPTPFEFRFYVMDALEPNAFAIPGGYIFATTGLLVLTENEGLRR